MASELYEPVLFTVNSTHAMKGDIMRDQTRNIEPFKVGAGTRVNEFDFHKHQGEMHEHQANEDEQGFGKTETKAERVASIVKKAHEKVLRRKKRR